MNSETLEEIERFNVVMYSRTCPASGVNEARRDAGASENVVHRFYRLVCTQNASLVEHVATTCSSSIYMSNFVPLSQIYSEICRI